MTSTREVTMVALVEVKYVDRCVSPLDLKDVHNTTCYNCKVIYAAKVGFPLAQRRHDLSTRNDAVRELTRW